MSIFGALEEFFSGTVYPHRYPVALVLIILLAGSTYLVWHLRWYRELWGHKYLTAAVGVPIILIASFGGYYTLSPLWQRSSLCEDNPLTADVDESQFEGERCDQALIAADGATDELPTSTRLVEPTATPPSATAEATASFEPRVLSQGTWVGADEFHYARGAALLLETEPGVYTVRVEDFSVLNGPDLFVYLSPNPDGYDDSALNLGNLKATDGAFNYELPAGTDVSNFKSVIVWCRQFGVLFGHATLD